MCFSPITIPLIPCLLCHAHPLPDFVPLLILHVITMPKHYEPSSYAELLTIPKFAECTEIFLRTGQGSFLASLQGYDNSVSLKFALGFNGRLACVGSLRSQLPQPRNWHGLAIDGSNTINCHNQAIIEYSSLNFKMFSELKGTPKNGSRMN